MAAPCAWDVDPTELCPEWDALDPVVQDAALTIASSWLWAATGRRFGVCDIEVRPCQDRRSVQIYRVFPLRFGGTAPGPFLDAGTWRNCGCGPSCCCAPRCRIVLRGPVDSVSAVTVDGELIDPMSYRVDVQRGTYYLVRLDGQCWPTCPEVEDPEAFMVSYGRGEPLPDILRVAASILACEFGKSISRKGECRLPARIQSLTRQGVTVDVEPSTPEEGLTGLNEVDSVITMLNPNKRKSRPVFLSPDIEEINDHMIVVEPGS